jgi:ATP-GRASP peptide maturase of grasp-with-spasm system
MMDKIEKAGFKDSVLVSIHNQVGNEYSELKNVFFDQFKDKEWLSSPAEISVSKLKVLGVAKALGFNIPETLVTSSKARLLDFLVEGRVICKPLTNVAHVYSDLDGVSYKMLTKEIKKDFLEDYSNEIISTSQMFQRMIDKDIEIRAFYLDEKIYSMAIFSQDDATTSVDFRNYNSKHPNRNVPYRLPDSVHNMIVKLFSKLKLSTGSVDLIKNTKGEYYFLEVNPVGQFLMVSDPCNYFLDKKVANYLISKV